MASVAVSTDPVNDSNDVTGELVVTAERLVLRDPTLTQNTASWKPATSAPLSAASSRTSSSGSVPSSVTSAQSSSNETASLSSTNVDTSSAPGTPLVQASPSKNKSNSQTKPSWLPFGLSIKGIYSGKAFSSKQQKQQASSERKNGDDNSDKGDPGEQPSSKSPSRSNSNTSDPTTPPTKGKSKSKKNATHPNMQQQKSPGSRRSVSAPKSKKQSANASPKGTRARTSSSPRDHHSRNASPRSTPKRQPNPTMTRAASEMMGHVTANNYKHRNSKNPMRGAVTIIPHRLYFCALNTDPVMSSGAAYGDNAQHANTDKVLNLRSPFPAPSTSTTTADKDPVYFFSIDHELLYWNFFLDFGPLNLGQLYRFSEKLNNALKVHKKVCVHTSASIPTKRANAVYCICAWQVLYLNRTPEEACYGFLKSSVLASPTVNSSLPPLSPLTEVGHWTVAPLPAFHDASPCACTYDLTLLHCLQGLQKARQYNFFTWNDLGRDTNNGHGNPVRKVNSIEEILQTGEKNTFNVQEYEYFEQVENGDLNWIVEGKILAVAGPSFQKNISPEGFCTLAPADYIPYFKKKHVGLVVRLNKRMYDEADFERAGIRHFEQFYLDGSCPPMKILNRVVRTFESLPKDEAFAVHCKAGLGRTGTCIGAYLMKHYKFTAAEAIGWMRICRPGMVIGPQQHFLEQIQESMWQEGDMMRIGLKTKHKMVPLCKMPQPSLPFSSIHLDNISGVEDSENVRGNDSTSDTPPSTPKRIKQVHTPSTAASSTASAYSPSRNSPYQPDTPATVTPTSSASPSSQQARQQHYALPANGGTVMPTSQNEATYGRVGQADGLLAARANRGGSKGSPANKSNKKTKTDPPGPYMASSNHGRSSPAATPGSGRSNSRSNKREAFTWSSSTPKKQDPPTPPPKQQPTSAAS